MATLISTIELTNEYIGQQDSGKTLHHWYIRCQGNVAFDAMFGQVCSLYIFRSLQVG